jgi:chromate transporter
VKHSAYQQTRKDGARRRATAAAAPSRGGISFAYDGAVSLGEVAALFLRLGVTAFGGPAAHVALMEDEVVRRRGWVTRGEFLDLYGATQLIPGPNSTEMAIHLGYRRAGWAGLVVAGACFILPPALLVGALAWAYQRWGGLPVGAHLFVGIKPVIIAVVAQALWGFQRAALKTGVARALAVAAAAALVFGAHELLILVGAGVLAMAARGRGRAVFAAPLAIPAAAAAPFGLWPMFLFFLKVGSVLFGSGYVLLAFLREDLVVRWRWLSESQLLDAIAVGQLTPGPVLTTATFVGWLLGGAPAAALATLGIFLPSFVLVALSGPLVPRLRRSPTAGAFLDGVNAASVALMAVVTAQLGRAALVDPLTIALALVAALLLFQWRVNSAWLILGGGLLGILFG